MYAPVRDLIYVITEKLKKTLIHRYILSNLLRKLKILSFEKIVTAADNYPNYIFDISLMF